MTKLFSTLAALAMAMTLSAAARADKGSSVTASDGSEQSSLESLARIDASTATSVKFSNGSTQSLNEIADAIRKEADGRLKDRTSSLNTAFGASLASGAFVVESVAWLNDVKVKVVKFVMRGVVSGSRMTVELAHDVSTPVGKLGDAATEALASAASKAVKGSYTVTVAIGKSGLVLIQGPIEGVSQAVNGNFGTSSHTIWGSLGKASNAFGSEIEQGFKN